MNTAANWYVLGAGAIGTLIASTLRDHGLRCELLTHRSQSERRLCISGNQKRELIARPLADQKRGAIQHLILAIKAYDNVDAVQRALPHLAADAVVISCANGLGFEGECQALLGGRGLHRAITTEAALRIDREIVQHTGHGRTLVGGPAAATSDWFADSLGGLPNWSWCNDIDAAAWRKFAINCVINPLTAKHACLNGELLAHPLSQKLAALCLETQQAITELGNWSADLSLHEQVRAVCLDTAENQSSMLQDLRAGRRTEIDYLNGHLVALARASGLSVPLSEALCELLVAHQSLSRAST